MTEAAKKRRYSVEEYLTLERAAVDKHEYDDGEILAMSGGTVRHSLIGANLIGAMSSRLKGRPCRVYEANLRVQILRANRYFYPDATIICGTPEIDPQDSAGETVTNVRVVFEVLSDSTERYDRGQKFEAYQLSPSIEEYVLISQTQPRIENYLRQPDGTWVLTIAAGLDAKMVLRSRQIEAPLAEIYDGVEFAARPESNSPKL